MILHVRSDAATWGRVWQLLLVYYMVRVAWVKDFWRLGQTSGAIVGVHVDSYSTHVRSTLHSKVPAVLGQGDSSHVSRLGRREVHIRFASSASLNCSV